MPNPAASLQPTAPIAAMAPPGNPLAAIHQKYRQKPPRARNQSAAL
jgi:hypothetical protein